MISEKLRRRRTLRETQIDWPEKGKQTRSPENIVSVGWGGEVKENGRREGREKRREQEYMNEQDAQEVGSTKRERKERAILIEGAIKGRERNMALGKFPEIHKNSSS